MNATLYCPVHNLELSSRLVCPHGETVTESDATRTPGRPWL